jgi:putative zinc finger/helix-turn-helix YgiT family protein
MAVSTAMRCPACRKIGTFRAAKGTRELCGVEIATNIRRCSSCGEELHDLREVQRQEREVAEILVRRGVRTGREFMFVRKVAGYRATEIAAMFDVRPETVSRWERGQVEVPRMAAYALGELFAHPRATRQKLDALARSE